MAFRVSQHRYCTYQICITILEAKHLPQNANPLVVVGVADRKRKTVVRECTDHPIYNEYFVFDLTCGQEGLLSTKILLGVYLRGCLRKLKFHGSISLEVGTVWEQPDHQYYHKWAMLTNPKDPTGSSKGYVKCDIAINVKGEKMKVHPETDGDDDIEGNLLLPVTAGPRSLRQKANYVFTIHRADGLPDMAACCVTSSTNNINPYVQVSFAGMKGFTSQFLGTRCPEFNERIVFKELFPALCQRVRIAVKHRVNSCRCTLVAECILNLGKISYSGEYGFPPTFGPSFLHLYGEASPEKNSCSCKCSTALPFYRGRLLLSLKTQLDEVEPSPGSAPETEPTLPIHESSLWRTEEYYLVGILYDVCMIDRRKYARKNISFEISLGNAGNRRFSRGRCPEYNGNGDGVLEERSNTESRSVPRMTGSLDGKYNYLPLGSRKPCMSVSSWWPNVNWRLHNSNNLKRIADFLEEKLKRLEDQLIMESPESYRTYNTVIRTLKSNCIRYLHILDTGRYDDEGGTTRLDRHRVNLCRKEIEAILKRIKTNGELPNNNYIRIAMVHAYHYLGKLKELAVDPQQALPDVFVWMIAGSKRVACARIPAQDLIYAEEETERGKHSAKLINVFTNCDPERSTSEDCAASKLELFLWLGNASYLPAFWSSVPPGYEVDHHRDIEQMPKYFEYTRSSTFQLRAHIFQARFDPGMDASGLLDPLVHVVFHGYTATTRAMKQTLDPLWDQTLILPPVTLHGTREYLKSQPPRVVLEVYDEDVCGAKEFCGRCLPIPLVKLSSETYSPPDFPPKLVWHKFQSQRKYSCSVLAAFELIETGENQVADAPMDSADRATFSIPEDIRPRMTSYRLEVIFWGVRDMRKINCMPVSRPRIIIECAGVHVKSEVMGNAKRFANFEEPHIIVDIKIPELDEYCPSVTIKAFDSCGFGCFKYRGICIIPNARVFLEHLITEEEYRAKIYETASICRNPIAKQESNAILPLPPDYDPSKEESRGLIAYKKMAGKDVRSKIANLVQLIKPILRSFILKERPAKVYGESKDDTLDWWSKYYASLELQKQKDKNAVRRFSSSDVATLEIYDSELETQGEFEGFQDSFKCFELWYGKKSDDLNYNENNFAGKFKGRICMYPWSDEEKLRYKTKSGRNAVNGLCDDYRSPESVTVLVRLYVVKGINLQPSDPLSGKSDPYLYVKLGRRVISERKNYIPNQLNPTFGRVFELEATFPRDYLLLVQVWDYDATSGDDLIGETRIDLENRFYSEHRGQCGISRTYNAVGYNSWRDRERPSEILDLLCKRNNLPAPEYAESYVRIGKKKFLLRGTLDRDADRQEHLALNALHHWQEFPICGCALVPEHIERRPLFNADRSGLEQGKLELWIDMFPPGRLPLKPAIPIAPHPPEDYEIRVIVWNAKDVPLEESQFLTGQKSSDIYVKGWIFYDDHQRTDVHYNSLNGEGNFNWRFIFRVTYSKSENVMIVRKKLSLFARHDTEEKLPCRLHLQVWDSDHFSQDDFLGALTLDLSRFPRGSSQPENCNLKLLEPRLPTINLFKTGHIRGWWPFARNGTVGKYTQAGKVELEITILRVDESNERPAGKARDPPQSLPPPRRPDTSFSWFLNPWKACRYVVCRYYAGRIVCCFLCLLLALLLAVGIYAFPGYLVKRLLGA